MVDAPGTGTTGGDDTGGGDDDTGNTPALHVAIDKTSMSTELRTVNQANITLTGSGGFSGPVTLAATVDQAEWSVVLDNPTVTIPADGTVTVKASVTIPSDAAVLAGNVNIAVTGGPTALSVQSAITAAPILTLVIKDDGNGKCAYPADMVSAAQVVKIKVGTKVHFLNMFNQTLVVHSNGQAEGIDHEGQGNAANIPSTAANDFYERTATTAGGAFSWYCHAPANDLGNAGNPFLQVVP